METSPGVGSHLRSSGLHTSDGVLRDGRARGFGRGPALRGPFLLTRTPYSAARDRS